MTTRLTVSSPEKPIKISVNTTFSAPDANNLAGPFYIELGLTAKNVLATVNLKNIGDAATAKTTLKLPGASTDYTFKPADGAVTISTKADGTQKAFLFALLDFTNGDKNTASVQFSDLTAKFHYVAAVPAIAATNSPAIPAHFELTSLKLAHDNGTSSSDGISNDGTINLVSNTGTTYSYSVDGGKTYAPVTGTSFDLKASKYEAGSIKVIEKNAKTKSSICLE